MDHLSMSIQDALSEADRLLAGRRTTLVTPRLSILARPIPTSRKSTRHPTGLDIGIEDLRHLMMLDAEMDRRSITRLTMKVSDSEIKERADQALRKMRLLVIISSMGGFLSGYNTGVLSGVLLPVGFRFDLSAEQKELIVSVTIAFAFVASLVGGKVNRGIGRRAALIIAVLFFFMGAITLLASQSFAMLVVGEALVGIGIGLESLTSPMYIAEVAKPNMRGMLVSAYALVLCCGQFTAALVDGLFSPFDMGWRFMYGLAAFPALIMFIGYDCLLPESPSWLIKDGNESQAEAILKTIRDTDDDVHSEILEIQDDLRLAKLHHDQESTWAVLWAMLCDTANRRALIVGCGLVALQHKCGLNAVLYYAASIYQMAGFDEITSIWLSALTSLAQIVGMAFSVTLVERSGRRPLLLTSLSLVTVAVVGLGFSFYLHRVESEQVSMSAGTCGKQPSWFWSGVTQYCFDCVGIEGCGYCDGKCLPGDTSGPFEPYTCSEHFESTSCANPYGSLSVFFMVMFLLTYGIGMAGLPWTYVSEIYPIKYRSVAVSIVTATNWFFNLLVSATFLSFSEKLLPHRAFWFYGIMSAGGVIWLYVRLPETKGKSLEEIYFAFSSQVPVCCSSTQLTHRRYGQASQISMDENSETYGQYAQQLVSVMESTRSTRMSYDSINSSY